MTKRNGPVDALRIHRAAGEARRTYRAAASLLLSGLVKHLATVTLPGFVFAGFRKCLLLFTLQ
ncbi:MAG TPA: hypothetical protein VEA17_24160 [Bordetella sp.]|nr:hypothetical protein [Bordetella sp.]